MKDLPVPEMSREQLSTFVTWMRRGERFSGGFIDSFVKDGRALQTLRRVTEL